MEDVLRQAYDKLLEEFKNMEAELKKKKMMLNEMAKSAHIEIPFPAIDEESAVTGRPHIKVDHFVGMDLSPAVVEYLRLVGKKVGARPWTEIAKALRTGGYDLGDGKTAEKQARKTVLKNTRTFKLIPPESFGLVDWYPKFKKAKMKGQKPKRRGRPPKNAKTDKVEDTPKRRGRKAKKEGEQSANVTVTKNE